MQNRTIVLDETLKVKELKQSKGLSFSNDNEKEVRNCIYGQIDHKNYISYLSEAWGSHYGIVVSPDIIFHIIMNEIATHIKNNSKHYRTLFSKSDEKISIVVTTSDPQLIDLALIMEQLKSLVPTDINDFLPTFTTTTISSKYAIMATFADAMQVYYKYGMMCCGIPKVKVTGTDEDWDKIINIINKFIEIFNLIEPKYFNDLISLIENIKTNDVAFWKNIFELERCGSGHETRVIGWITKLFIKLPRLTYECNFPSLVSKVPYKFLNTNQDFVLNYGLFSSNIENEFLIPDFGFTINEVKK